jgi:hypothetical protein
MKFYPIITIIIIYSFFYFIGCVSYTTLQSAKTLDPGEVLIGGGSAIPVSGNEITLLPELNARIGIVNKFDVGIKYSVPSLYFFDGKIQIIDAPVTLSADVGWSYFSYTGSSGKSRGKTTCWYPMLIAGQEKWYVGIKEVYFHTRGEFEFFGLNKFEGSGWITTNIVAGGIIGDKVRLLPEMNFIIPKSGKLLFVPALGLQLIL